MASRVPGNGFFDPQARYAALDERVTNMGTRLTSLETNMASGFRETSAQLGSLANDLRTGQKTQWATIWPGLAVLLTFLSIIGALVYLPIQTGISELKEVQKDIAVVLSNLGDKFVPRTETERSRMVSDAANKTRDEAINNLRDSVVPREAWLLRNEHVNSELEALDKRVLENTNAREHIPMIENAVADIKRRLDKAGI